MKRILVIILLVVFVGGFIFNSFFSNNSSDPVNVDHTDYVTDDKSTLDFESHSITSEDTILLFFPDNVQKDSFKVVVNGQVIPNYEDKILLTSYQSGTNSADIYWYYQGAEMKESYRWTNKAVNAPLKVNYKLKRVLKHDDRNYTQGYEFMDGQILESTGQQGDSRIVLGNMGSAGQDQFQLGTTYFGEGITVFKDQIYLVTWKNREGFVFDKEFNKLRNFYYNTEGWGLSHNDTALILSDGSHKLYFKEGDNFTNLKVLEVYDDKGPLSELNELEVVGHYALANLYGYDEVAIIDLRTGFVAGTIDFSGLKNQINTQKRIDVLNGIAYNEKNKQFYITGKLWPQTFEVEIDFNFNQ